jgi:hypothetical protein
LVVEASSTGHATDGNYEGLDARLFFRLILYPSDVREAALREGAEIVGTIGEPLYYRLAWAL